MKTRALIRSRIYKIVFLYFFITIGISSYSQERQFKGDINNDKISDSIQIDKFSNKLKFIYTSEKKRKVKDFYFFKDFDSSTVNIDVKIKSSYLSLEVRYAPRYLDRDVLIFNYDKKKDNWLLKSIKVHRSNPNVENSPSSDCLFIFKKKLYISNNLFSEVQQMYEDKNFKKHFSYKQCKFKNENNR